MTPAPWLNAASAAVTPGEKRRRVDGEREQQPAEEADAEKAENESDDDHGGGLREIEI